MGSARTTHAIYREHVKATDAVEGDSHQRWVLVPPIRNAIIMLLAVGVRRGVGGGGGSSEGSELLSASDDPNVINIAHETMQGE